MQREVRDGNKSDSATVRLVWGGCRNDAPSNVSFLHYSAHSSLGELCHECLAGFFRDQEINKRYGANGLIFGTRLCLEAPLEINSTNYGIYSGCANGTKNATQQHRWAWESPQQDHRNLSDLFPTQVIPSSKTTLGSEIES